MRRKEREITDKNTIEQILSGSQIIRIAMIDVDEPYIVPLNYGYRNNTIYIHSASSGRKIEILQRNRRVCFEIEYRCEVIKNDIPCEWSAKYRSVIGYGTVDIITDAEAKKKGLDIIMAQHGRHNNEYIPGNVDSIVILRLNIETVTGKQAGEWSENS